ncbi:SDR family NAD(P)-dependent oxidoreductase [Sandarakinorhabdus limnophila]|uniref:SDR family NAD(P)-dependent oxidoreductase n=1 Tax=Sandarakinorhabdus limnophila TaxID=210512 RepID=UPI0026EFB806|nr:SDR family oxidoreductase [Sandarakinorhabdus limnophila]
MIDWTGQRVLITGAASGIGRALAVQLAQRGALVTAADINAEGVAETAALCGGEALVLDLADGAAGPAAVAQLVASHGRLDAVFANAGIGYRRRLLKADLDDAGLARLWEINMLGPTRLVQALCKAAEAGGWRARIVITGSENSLSLPPSVQNNGIGLYAASKHAVLILAEWLATESRNAGKPLDVHVLLPGGVYTGMTAPGLGDDPARWPADMGIIMPERAAELCLKGLDFGLFHIPTHAHLQNDMAWRYRSVADASAALGLNEQA